MILFRSTIPLKSQGRRIQPERAGLNWHALGTNVPTLRPRSVSVERETFHVEHIRAFQSDIYGQQVFHVEHKDKFCTEK